VFLLKKILKNDTGLVNILSS